MFTWFYCLDIIDAVLLITAVSVMFLVMKGYCCRCKWWSVVMISLSVVWLLVIGYVTLASREPEAGLGVKWMPFYSYYLGFSGINEEMLRSCFMNVVLFYPVGLVAGAAKEPMGKRWKRVLLLAALGSLVSVAVEVIQYTGQLGLAEVDDVIHNTLGVALGALIGGMPTIGRRKVKNENAF